MPAIRGCVFFVVCWWVCFAKKIQALCFVDNGAYFIYYWFCFEAKSIRSKLHLIEFRLGIEFCASIIDYLLRLLLADIFHQNNNRQIIPFYSG